MAGLTTSQLRRAWAPPCQGPWAKITLYGGATFGVRPAIVEAVKALNEILKRHGYKATPPDCGCYNCRQITGGDDYSLHAFAIALDINWLDNGYGPVLVTDMPMAMIEEIEAIRTKDGQVVWRWGGRYVNNKDAMHFEIVCTPASLATGINWKTVAGKPVIAIVRPVLQVGMSGPDITTFQNEMNWLLALTGPWKDPKGKVLVPKGSLIDPDGDYGRITRDRCSNFERYSNGVFAYFDSVSGNHTSPLQVDGKATVPTRQRLATLNSMAA